jgi:hypothetical protein
VDVNTYQVHPTGRFKVDDPNAMIMCVARKNHSRAPIWPMQSKYLNNPDLKGDTSGSAIT